MSWSIGLNVGDTVLEAVAQKNAQDSNTQLQPQITHRYCMPYGTLETLLTQFLTTNNIENISRVQIVSAMPLYIIEALHGSKTAVLTTAGFENWLELTHPLKTRYFTSHPQRCPTYVDREHFFGISERTNSQGHIEKLLNESELEFLTAKLQLLEIKNVAIGFLHSNKNAENEKRAQAYLEAHGFKVFISSDHEGETERERFWAAILNAYVTPTFIERLNAIEKALTDKLTSDAVVKLGAYSLSDVTSGKVLPLHTAFSFSDFMSKKFARTTDLLYCGVQELIFFPAGSPESKVCRMNGTSFSAPHISYKKMSLQPLTQIGKGFFSEFTFTGEKVGYDPGPVSFGRGLTPTLIDILILNGDKNKLPTCMQNKITDRGLTRMKETLAVYARNLSEGENISAEDLSKKLHSLAVASWNAELNNSKNLTICGPLAPLLAPYLNAKVVGDDFFTTTALLMKDDTI